VKLATCPCDQVGPVPKYELVPNHAIVEEAFGNLYLCFHAHPELKRQMSAAVDEKRHLELAQDWVEARGSAAVGFFSHNLNLLPGDARYMDALERELYNGARAGVALAGNSYSYINPLEAAHLKVNGKPVENVALVHGYATRHRRWKSGEVVQVSFDVPVQLVKASAKIEAEQDRVALMRGPGSAGCQPAVSPTGSRQIGKIAGAWEAVAPGGLAIRDTADWQSALPARFYDAPDWPRTTFAQLGFVSSGCLSSSVRQKKQLAGNLS
jgi:hypothetical protein